MSQDDAHIQSLRQIIKKTLVTLAFGKVEKANVLEIKLFIFPDGLCSIESEENFGKVDLEPKF